MTHASLPAFAGYGIELEYMIVDRDSLAVRPIADALLRNVDGEVVTDIERGPIGWSNELVLHVVELKNRRPDASLDSLPESFQGEIRLIDERLAAMGARLMPTAMHPWMDPRAETRLWPHAHADIYRAYDRIFDCRRHGFANLQSMHVNLPFADDAEFARLHAAVRLVLPILPALAASSPLADGQVTDFLDTRMEAYRSHQARLPASIGRVIPPTVNSRAEYADRVLAPMHRQAAPLDPGGLLRHEWLNARGAIPRFDRGALEIRVIDMQECPLADIAIAAACVAVVESLYRERWSSLAEQQACDEGTLVEVLLSCIRHGERAGIGAADYLRLLGFPSRSATAAELWHHLVGGERIAARWRQPLAVILGQGPLARRILRALGPACSRGRMEAVYRALCDALSAGRMFIEPD